MVLEHIERMEANAAQLADPTQLEPRDVADAIPDVRNVIADLSAMQDIGRGTLEKYAQALKP